MLKRFLLLGVLLIVFAPGAQAGPITTLSGEFISNGQIVGPNAEVTFRVRITNTGTEDFVMKSTQVGVPWATPVGNYGEDPSYLTFYWASYPDFSASPLNPTQSIDFTLYSLRPFEAGAALGSYAGKTDAKMDFGYGWDAPYVSFGIPTWTVSASGSVPDPGSSALLLGMGLAGLRASRRWWQ